MSEPGRDRFGLVRREVIQHDVDLQVFRHVQVNELEEGEHFLGGVTGLGVIEHVTSRHAHRREQIRGAVSLVVMGHGGAATLLHG